MIVKFFKLVTSKLLFNKKNHIGFKAENVFFNLQNMRR